MLIVCPNCAARYEVAALALPAQGRDLECTACGHAWLHLPTAASPFRAPAEAPAGPAGAPEAVAEVTGRGGDDPHHSAAADDADDSAAPQDAPEPDFALSPIESRLPPEVLALLREEAARELAARAQDRPETSPEAARPDAGIDAAAPDAVPDASPGAEAAPSGAVTPGTPTPAPVAEPSIVAGRPSAPFLPLPGAAAQDDAVPPAPSAPVWPVEAEPAPLWTPARPPADGPGGLALFGALCLLALSIAAFIYVVAPSLGQAMPSLGPILSVYVDAADWILDGLRGWILSLPARLSGMGG